MAIGATPQTVWVLLYAAVAHRTLVSTTSGFVWGVIHKDRLDNGLYISLTGNDGQFFGTKAKKETSDTFPNLYFCRFLFV